MPAWAIVLCKYRDRDDEPISVDFCQKYFLGKERGGVEKNLYSYWKDITYGKVTLDGSQVFGPIRLSYTQEECNAAAKVAVEAAAKYRQVGKQRIKIGKDLNSRVPAVQMAADEVSAALDLSTFTGLVLIHNEYGDAGAAWTYITGRDGSRRHVPAMCLHPLAFDPNAETPTWHGHGTEHESGHMLKVGHAWLLNPPEEYGNAWDVMGGQRFDGPGWVVDGYRFRIDNPELNTPLCGPGLNAPNLEHLGCFEPKNIRKYPDDSRLMTVTLTALNHRQRDEVLMAQVDLIDSKFKRLTVELRWQDGWDRGIPRNAFLLHMVDEYAVTYLVPALMNKHDWIPGDTYTTQDKRFRIKFLEINTPAYTGTIQIIPILPYLEILQSPPEPGVPFPPPPPEPGLPFPPPHPEPRLPIQPPPPHARRPGPIPMLVFPILWRMDHFVRSAIQTVRNWFVPRRPPPDIYQPH